MWDRNSKYPQHTRCLGGGKSAQPAQLAMWDRNSKHLRCTKAPKQASVVHKGTQAGASQHSWRNRQCGTATASIRGAQRHPSGHPQHTEAPKRASAAHKAPKQASAAHKALRRGQVSTAGAIGNVGPQQQASVARTGTQVGIRGAQGTQVGASHHSRCNQCGTATAVASAVWMAAGGGGIASGKLEVALSLLFVLFMLDST